MARFKARMLNGKLLELLGLEGYIEDKVNRVLDRLGLRSRTESPTDERQPNLVAAQPGVELEVSPVLSPVPTPVPTPVAPVPATVALGPKPRGSRKSAAKKKKGELGKDRLAEALARHPRREALVRVGKRKDQLLRSLVPLYLARELNLDLNSGAISLFWAQQGLKYAPPNAAKALRQHVGYARATKTGRRITPNGVKYVEEALASAE